MRYYIVILGLVVGMSSLFAQNDAIEAELKLADGFITNKNYDEALKHVENALKIDGLYLIALEKKVSIMILSENENAALKEINSMISENPQQPEYYYIRAIIHLYKQKPNKAIQDLNDAEIIYSMPAEYMERVYLRRGTAYYFYGDFMKAEIDFKAAININPKNATVYHSWGMLKYEEGLYEDAIKYFSKALQYEDKSPVAHYNIGMAHSKVGETEEACHHFNQACILGHRSACKIYYLQCTE